MKTFSLSKGYKGLYFSFGYSRAFASWFLILEIGTWHYIYCKYNKRVGR